MGGVSGWHGALGMLGQGCGDEAPQNGWRLSAAGALTAWPGKSAICLPPSVSSAARAASRALYLMNPNLHGGDSR